MLIGNKMRTVSWEQVPWQIGYLCWMCGGFAFFLGIIPAMLSWYPSALALPGYLGLIACFCLSLGGVVTLQASDGPLFAGSLPSGARTLLGTIMFNNGLGLLMAPVAVDVLLRGGPLVVGNLDMTVMSFGFGLGIFGMSIVDPVHAISDLIYGTDMEAEEAENEEVLGTAPIERTERPADVNVSSNSVKWAPRGITYVPFSIQKDGMKTKDNNDVVLPYSPTFVIADGATEGWGSGLWAKIVAIAFAAAGTWIENDGPSQELLGRLKAGRAKWDLGSPLPPNYTGSHFTKKCEGAGTTLAAISIGDDLESKLIAVGDSCIVVLRNEKVLLCFPVRSHEEIKAIGTGPNSVHTFYPARFRHTMETVTLMRGDVVLLMTDALSEFFLRMVKDGSPDWKDLLTIGSPDQFEKYVQDLRDSQKIENDDTSLLVIRIGQDQEADAP